MKNIKKDSKQMLFEMMHKVGGMPLKENLDIDSDDFDGDFDSWVKDYDKKFKNIPDDKITILAQKFMNSEYTKDLMGLNKFIHDNYKKLYLKPETMIKLIDIIGIPDLKNQWHQLNKK